MRFHLVSLPHTQTTAEFISCAYTQKVVKFARMMMARGHEIILYSGEENEAPCTEHVVIVSDKEQRKWWGEKNLDAFYPIVWDLQLDCWTKTNARVARHIKRGLKTGAYDKRDPVCVLAGTCNQAIQYQIPNTVAEYGVGYTGIFGHCAFESHAHRHVVYAMRNIGDGRAFDEVIPNYFDPAEFELDEVPEREDHLLYVGRLIMRKGVHIAAQAAERAGRRLLVAGQGIIDHGPGMIQSEEMKIEGKHIEYIGTLDVKQRAYEMARAHAVMVPTTYLEPFGGTNVEAGFAGTPVITSNWGAFPETVIQGENGYRCNIIRDYARAIELAGSLGLDRDAIKESVNRRYSLEAVAPRFEEWFERLDTLWEEGFYAP